MKHSGFSLIELMMALVVLAIMVGTAIPSFQSLMRDQRTSGMTNDLVSALHLARSEAVKRKQAVTVCRRANLTDDPPTCALDNATSYTVGWLVTTDDSDGSATLRAWNAPASNPVIEGPSGGVTFNSMGGVNAGGAFSLTMPGAPTDQERCVTISQTGRIHSAKGVACP